MRVLVISLLRLGDFLQIVPTLTALKVQFNIRELDVLVYRPTLALKPMIPVVDNWFSLDRDALQAGLGRADVPLLTSFSLLKERMDQIDHRHYHLVLNLTQTLHSGWLAGYLSAEQRLGLSFDVKGTPHFHSPWFDYLNAQNDQKGQDLFHLTDVFFYGAGLKGADRVWNLRETRHGRAEWAALQLEDRPSETIVLQTRTSDRKKNWPIESWSRMLSQLILFRPKAQFVALGAPNEEAQIDELIQHAAQRGTPVHKAILSLEGAHSLLKRASLLITGDTSIKHLANASNTPVVELSLGSSDLRRTGVYRPGALILQAAVDCAPCPHSSPCRQASHQCAERLSPELVSSACHQYLHKDWSALKSLAREFAGEAQFYRTRVPPSGFWWAEDLTSSDPSPVLNRLLERVATKFQLSLEHNNPLAQFGSESLNLKREMEAVFPNARLLDLKPNLDEIEAVTLDATAKATSLLVSVRRRTPALQDILHFLADQNTPQDRLSWLEKTAANSTEGVVDIGGLRRLQTELEQCHTQLTLKAKLARALKSQLMESK